jgi:PIN domain nuclease of toxin-antitoxin system
VNVLDTHAWVWWTDGDPRLSDAAAQAIERDGEVGVSTISVWELATLERLGRIRLLPDLRTWVRRALAPAGVVELTLTSDVASVAGMLPPPFPGDPADRIIYATALANGASLVTADRRLARHDPARVVW